MQQKKLKYLLLLGVASIWGIILYKVFAGINDNINNTNIPLPKKDISFKDTSHYEAYSLLINYVDPFGVQEEEDNALKNSTDSLIKATEKFLRNGPDIIKPDISFIQYKGGIENAVTHKKAAILSINGKDEFVNLNSKLKEDIKVNIIKKDKIQITYNGDKYWIKRQ